MLPLYAEKEKACNYCDSELYVGYECIESNDDFYCNEDCLKEELLENVPYKDIYLTNDKTMREGM